MKGTAPGMPDMPAARGMQDLPIELWHDIMDYLGRDEDGRMWSSKQLHQLAKLCLVSRHVYARTVPLLYQDVSLDIESLPLFLATISSSQSLGVLVKKYVLLWTPDIERAGKVVAALDDQSNISAIARSSLVMDLLQQTVQLLPPQLHELRVLYVQGDPLGEALVNETWRIDLRSMTGLRTVCLCGFGVDKVGFDALLNMEALQNLRLNSCYLIETALPTKSSTQPSAVTLPGQPELYLPGLKRLCLYGSHDLKPHIKAFLPRAMHLQDLEIDSLALWERTNSWEERDHLYKILPSSLETLQVSETPAIDYLTCCKTKPKGQIHFPERLFFDSFYSIPDYQEAFDGVFLHFNNQPQDPANSRTGYKEADIPTSRYLWLTNLPGHVGSGAGPAEKMYLPSLKTLQLVENRVHDAENTEDWIEYATVKEPEKMYFQLPTEIEAVFAARSIEVSILVNDAWTEPYLF